MDEIAVKYSEERKQRVSHRVTRRETRGRGQSEKRSSFIKNEEHRSTGGGASKSCREQQTRTRELAVFLSVQMTAGDRASEVRRQKPDSREAVSVDLTGKCLGERECLGSL